VKESDIQRQILDYLAAKRIMAFRMNTGMMRGEHKGKAWAVRFGTPGMADVLAFPKLVGFFQHSANSGLYNECTIPYWIEVKAPKGKQSELQKSFQAQVEAEGHKYVLARSIDEVMEALGV
jgi:hypothetical protein